MDLSETKILTSDSLLDQLLVWRQDGLKVVFTNGCFDILHLGHIDYLEKAKNLGDVLIVGLNSDASVKRLKGNNRPIMNEVNRSRVIAALQFVDVAIMFDDDTPFDLIKLIKPDVLVKGSDYKIENIVGANFVLENGGIVETIKFVVGYSTSSIVEKLKK